MSDRTANATMSPVGATEGEEYDPFAHRPQGQLNSDFAVFVHLLKSTVGNGMFFLPHAFKRTGYLSAIICSVLISAIATHMAVVTVQCAQILCKRGQTPVLNFAETAEASFRLGPKAIRRYAITMNVGTNVIICFVQYQTAVIYFLYVASSFQQVIEHLSGIRMDQRVYLIIFSPVYCGLALVPNLKYLVPVSLIGTTFLGIGFFITLYYLFEDFPGPGRLNMFTNVFSLPLYCSVFIFALYNMSILLPLENTMKKPKHMPVILSISMILNTCIYIAFGFFGYNKYIDACDTVIKNLPLDEIAAQIVKIAITLSVMFTYGLQYYVPVSILWPMIARKISKENRCCCEMLFRLGGVFATTLLAIAIPRMIPLLGLFSAVSMTTVMLFIPAVIELATKWEDPGLKRFNCLLVKNVFILVVWALLLVSGAIESTMDIVKEYSSGRVDVKAESC